jgi:hypothetical protein
LGEVTEHNDIITGGVPNPVDNSVEDSDTDPKKKDNTEETGLSREHTMTNWRQE